MVNPVDLRLQSSREEASQSIDRLVELVSASKWVRRAEKIRAKWPSLGDSAMLLRRHVTELHLVDLLRQHRETGQYFGPYLSALDIEVHHFSQLMNLLREAISDEKARELLNKHLQKSEDLNPLRFELDTLNYGLQRGFDVEAADAGGSAHNDFNMKRNDFVVAVECKHVHGDKGFPLKFDRASELCDQIVKKGKPGPEFGDMLIEITAADRLDDLHALSKAVSSAVYGNGSRTGSISRDRFEVRQLSDIEKDGIVQLAKEVPDLTEHQAEIAKLIRLDASGLLFMIDTHNQFLLVSLTSQRRTDPGEVIFEMLLDAADRQLPRELPGLLTVELEEFTPADMEHHLRQHHKGSMIDLSGDLFRRRPHIAGIIMVPGHRLYVGDQPWGMDGRKILCFANSNHDAYADPDFRALVPRDID